MHQLTRWSGPFLFSATAFVLSVASACSSSSGTGLGDDSTDDAGMSSSSSGGSTSSSGSSSGGSSSGTKADGGSGGGATVLDCGGSCNLSTHTCCKDPNGANNSCVAHGTACPQLFGSFSCEGVVDCPSGQVCCGFADETALKAGTECRSTCPTMSASASQGQAQVCKGDAECAAPKGNGMKCIPQMCVGGANLSLCGLTSSPPYSCTAN
jgi:hypothetical protein